MNQKITNVLAGIGLLFIILILFVVFIPFNIDFDFYVDETHEPINGDVYLGNEYLGQTQNGKISLADLSRVRDNLARARYRFVDSQTGFINAYIMLQEITGIKFNELNNWE